MISGCIGRSPMVALTGTRPPMLLQIDDVGAGAESNRGFGLVAHAGKEEGHVVLGRGRDVAITNDRAEGALSAEPAEKPASSSAPATTTATARLSLALCRPTPWLKEAAALAGNWSHFRLPQLDLIGGAVGV